MKTKYVVLNGPPDSGKDFIAELLEKRWGMHHARFKSKLYKLAIRMSGVLHGTAMRYFTDRTLKEKTENSPFQVLGASVSPRQYLQFVSEEVIKPLYGKHYFGQALIDETYALYPNVVVSDGGFEEEVLMLPGDETLIIRLHAEGCSFEDDTRDYLTDEFCSSNGFMVCDFTNEKNGEQDLLRTLETSTPLLHFLGILV